MPTTTEDDRFASWMRKVNVHLEDTVQLRADELPDFDYALHRMRGLSPRSTARAALRAAGYRSA